MKAFEGRVGGVEGVVGRVFLLQTLLCQLHAGCHAVEHDGVEEGSCGGGGGDSGGGNSGGGGGNSGGGGVNSGGGCNGGGGGSGGGGDSGGGGGGGGSGGGDNGVLVFYGCDDLLVRR